MPSKLKHEAPLNFQSMLLRLSEFWADEGCVIALPYDLEVGAGTMCPETFLRVLGPEPWRVAYIQPSRRPADGRYGENPNRLLKHTQMQVILKPPPENIQDMYLESLGALGIDIRHHDIRFEEDNWEAPTLGAWGIGWQVMLDGLEITQFTYFQQSGGVDLDPVSVELTYGMERIAAFLQNVEDVYQVRWNETVTYGDMRRAEELEFSVYDFEAADAEVCRKLLDLYEAEATRLLGQYPQGRPEGPGSKLETGNSKFETRNSRFETRESGIRNPEMAIGHSGSGIQDSGTSSTPESPVPSAESRVASHESRTPSPESRVPGPVPTSRVTLSLERFPLRKIYDLTLKCSHLFNILDARGAISVTERVALIARVRKLACEVAAIYLDRQPAAEVRA